MDVQFTESKILLWKAAIALQALDGLCVSDALLEVARQNALGKISLEESLSRAQKTDCDSCADIVAARAFAIFSLPKDEFDFCKDDLCKIHNALFEDIAEGAGEFRAKEIAKKEWALDGELLRYPNAKSIEGALAEQFEKKGAFNFGGLDEKKLVSRTSEILCDLWQIHPFEKFNTQAIAVFFVKCLERFGVPFSISALSKNPVYFRNALARAAFSEKNFSFIEKFMENFLAKKNHALNYKAVHIGFEKAEEKALEPKASLESQNQKSDSLEKKSETKKSALKKAPQKKSASNDASQKPKPERKSSIKKSGCESARQKKALAEKSRCKKSASENAAKVSAAKKTVLKKKSGGKKEKPKSAAGFECENKDVLKICSRAKIECTEKVALILEFLLENKAIANSQARKVANISTESARKILSALFESGVVKIQGANRSRVYVMKK